MSSTDTKMIPLNFQTGINRERTRYSSKGHWYDGNRVRFRDGQPENIRGWTKKVNNQFHGVARAITSWASLEGSSYAAFATDQLLYIFSGGAIYDVTPIATSVNTSSTAPLCYSSTGSTKIVVDWVSQSPTLDTIDVAQNTFVIVSTAGGLSVGGVALDGTFRVSLPAVLSTDRYFKIITSTSAASNSSVVVTNATFQFLLNAGQQTQTEGLGYGTYLWDVPRTTLGAGTGYGTPASVGTGFTVKPRNWTFTNWGEDLVATPRGGQIYIWQENNGVNTRSYAITSAPTENTLVIGSPLTQRLVACGTMGVTTSVFDPMLVRWCAAVDEGGYNEWIPAESNTANSQRLGDGSEIRGAVYSRNQILIWTDNSLHGMTPTGGDYIFTTVQIGTNCGLVGLHAAVEADGVAFWMSQKNFFMYDGTLRILPCSVRQYIFDDLNDCVYDKVYAGFNKEFTEVTWLYVAEGSSECDKYVSYNPVDGWWSFGEAIWTTWEDKKLFNTILTTGSGSYLYDNEPEGIYTGDGAAITSFVETGDFDLDAAGNADSMIFVDRIVPDVALPQGGSIDLSLSFKRYPLSSSSTKGPFTITSATEKVSMRGRGRQASLKVERGTTANTRWKLGKVHVDMMADGPR